MLLFWKLTPPQGHVPWGRSLAKATHHTYGARGGAGPGQPPPRRVKFTQSPTPISPGAPRKPAHLNPPLATSRSEHSGGSDGDPRTYQSCPDGPWKPQEGEWRVWHQSPIVLGIPGPVFFMHLEWGESLGPLS